MLGQSDLVNARGIEQGIQDRELNRRDIGCGQMPVKNSHRNLVRPPDQMSRRGVQIKAGGHFWFSPWIARVITNRCAGAGSYSKRA
jgi:hypothetical protein